MKGARLRRWERRTVSTWVGYMTAWVGLGLKLVSWVNRRGGSKLSRQAGFVVAWVRGVGR